MTKLTPQQKDLLHLIICVLLIISMIGYLIIIALYLKFPQLRKLHRKLLFTLAIYDFISGITFLVPSSRKEELCKTQSFFVTFFTLLPPYWSSIIAIFTWLLVVYHKTKKALSRLYIYVHCFILLFSFIFSLLSVLTSANKPLETDWCVPDQIWMILTYSWYWLCILTCFVFYLLSVFRIRKLFVELQKLDKGKKTERKSELVIQLKMLCIPLTFIWSYVWPSICRVMEFHDKTPPVWLAFMHGINFPLCGFIYCLIFVFFTSSVRKLFFGWIACKKSHSYNLYSKKNKSSSSPSSSSSSESMPFSDTFSETDSSFDFEKNTQVINENTKLID
ncbi:g protein-coupled receptor [Anaeramoeba flamelloides]|uniref:G protein-coupled receptor n=1 Tax=Anaeramoeba flamelloides TaxID=1746091 RepID=A0AAV7ZGX9_9EUKA|nr:g protein-coupled receptor [Anaeramoeba flamelloides]